jgi:SAGA-associated factor 29
LGGPGSRLNAKEKSSRSGSIATTREASVKIEDGAESVASSADGVSTSTGTNKGISSNSRPSNRLLLQEGEIVFCRHDRTKAIDAMEGEGILCKVTAVIGEGKQRRYEVQDADTGSDPPPPQRASVAQLMQIPHTNKGLGDLPKGKQVLAQYPDTTTFYKAEVNEPWRAKVLAAGEKGELVRLNFQEDEETREVERRFVLLTEK